MKTRYSCLILLFLIQLSVKAQMKIGDNSTTINSASLLELETTNKGLVFPRVSLTNVSSSSPLPSTLLNGTIVYNTNASVTNGNGKGLYAWQGSVWVPVTPNITAYAWSLTGNSGTSASTNFIGTTDAIDFIAKTNSIERLRITSTGNIGIGLSNPSYALSVLSASNPLYLSGVQATSTLSSDSIVTINAGIVKKTPYSSFTNSFWGLTGNSGTSASTNFIGTIDAVDFIAKTNNTERMRLTSGGNVGINTSSPGSTLDVKGTLRLSGSSSGYVGFTPAAAAGSTTYTLPSADGTAGQALVTNGSGTLSWAVTAATIGTIGTGATIAGTATGKYYCTGSYITLPPGKFIVNVYMMLSSSPSVMNQTTANQPGSFFIKSFFADASLGTTAGTTVSPALPQSNVSPDVVGNGKLISGSISVGQTYNPITGFVVINNTSGANKSYYYWVGWVALTNVLSTNSLPLIGGTNYGEDNIVAYPTN